jgi:ABC-type Zn2+ transport system substrate-binding protein/surface adhesin
LKKHVSVEIKTKNKTKSKGGLLLPKPAKPIEVGKKVALPSKKVVKPTKEKAEKESDNEEEKEDEDNKDEGEEKSDEEKNDEEEKEEVSFHMRNAVAMKLISGRSR